MLIKQQGGLRTKGLFTKQSTTTNPLLSIITVVYNSRKFIENTIISIHEQTYSNIEHLIIDGGSTDGTLDIIKKHDNKIAFWISEPDKGLYDAMNKGIEHASGDYLLFINSGDLLYDKNIIEKVFANSNKSVNVLYGETIMINENNSEIGMRRLKTPDNLNWKSLKNGMLVSHQSFIAKTEIVPRYNLKYKYASDFDWMVNILKKLQGSSIQNTHLILSRFLDGGQTKQTIIPGLRERFEIMCRDYGTLSSLFNHIAIGIKFVWFVIRNRRF